MIFFLPVILKNCLQLPLLLYYSILYCCYPSLTVIIHSSDWMPYTFNIISQNDYSSFLYPFWNRYNFQNREVCFILYPFCKSLQLWKSPKYKICILNKQCTDLFREYCGDVLTIANPREHIKCTYIQSIINYEHVQRRSHHIAFSHNP